MDAQNVESQLLCNFGRRSLVTYRSVKKFFIRIDSVRLDIHYLKTCRSKDLIPGFLWFKTANNNLQSSPQYRESQRRLLNAEIDYKYQHFNNVKTSYETSLNLLKECCPESIFQQLQEILITVCQPILNEKKQTIEKKLRKLGYVGELKPNVDRDVVKNLSTRVLSDDEIDCLAHGLDFGLLPKHFDNMNAAGNIERFFHNVTSIYENQKKLRKDLKEKDVAIPKDTRLLNSNELTLAYNLRSLTDSFRSQANRYQKQQHFIHTEQKQYYQLLKQLNDKSIVVTRPDKGRGIVLLDRNDYNSKMNEILSDTTKFKSLPDDPTIRREDKLTRLLRRLHKNGYISQEFYDMARPTGSNPGRLYGLPKTHKDGVPLRPVLSSIGTFNYSLAKLLKQMLSTMIQNEAIIKDSFAFVKELRSESLSELSEYKMVSFDIVSLYTNIPLAETIKIILDYLYKDKKPLTTIPKNDMKKLLDLATEETHFLFNGTIYDQTDGVSMGSPLAPLLAEIFLQEFEKNHLPSFKEKGIVYWKRYVDDTFVLLDPEVDAKVIAAQLSQCHPSLKFTCEEEYTTTNDNLSKEGTLPMKFLEKKHLEKTMHYSIKKKRLLEENRLTEKKDPPPKIALSFLDVLVERQPGIGFETRKYRKETFSGLLTRWDSFVPKQYKYNAISTMVYRAIRICSSYTTLEDEFDMIRELALHNGYPLAFVESIIRRQLNLIHPPRTTTPKESETDYVVLRVPFYGKPSQVYAKRITAAVSKQYPLKKVRVVYDVTTRIGQNFTTKDQIPTELKAGVVYEATCPQCNDKYIGKTIRHLKVRVNEHLSEQNKLLSTLTEPPEPIVNSSSSSKNVVDNHSTHTMMTRTKSRAIELEASQRQLLPEIVIAPPDQGENKETANSLQLATQAHVPRSQNKTTEPIMQRSQPIDSNDISVATTPADKKTDKPTYDSALTKHYVSTGHSFTSKDFKILLSDRNERRLLVKESLLIRQMDPKINGTDRSIPLYIFPDGIPKSHNVRLNQPAQTTDIHMTTDPPPPTDQPRTTTTS